VRARNDLLRTRSEAPWRLPARSAERVPLRQVVSGR